MGSGCADTGLLSLPATHGGGRWTQEIPYNVRGRWQEALPIPVFQQNGQPVPIQPSPHLAQPACTRGCQKPEPAIPCPLGCRTADSGEVERLQCPPPAGDRVGWWGTGSEKGRHEGGGTGRELKGGCPGIGFSGETSTHTIFSLGAGKQRRSASETPFCYYNPDQSQTHPSLSLPSPPVRTLMS